MTHPPGLGMWIRLGLRHWKFLAVTALVAGALSFGICTVLPKTYQARASVLPPHEPERMLQFGGRSPLQLESLLPFSAGVTFLDVYLAVLNSDRVARTLIERHDLQEHYKASTRVQTLKAFRKKRTVQPTFEGLVEVFVEDRDPRLAADLANDCLAELEVVLMETRTNAGRVQREFLEERLVHSRADLDSLESALARLQAEQGITALSQDATEAAIAAGELMGKRLALSVRLQMMDQLEVGDSPGRQRLETELRALDREIAKLPALGIDLARHLRDVRIEARLHEALARQLENARLEELKDTPVVEVLDAAVVPDRHVRPRRGLMTLAGLVAGFGLAFAWVSWTDPVR